MSYRSICALILIGLVTSFGPKPAAAGNSFKITPTKIKITINIETPAPSSLRKRWEKAIERLWNTSEGGGPHKVCGLEVVIKVKLKTQGPKPRSGYHKTQDTRPQLGGTDPEENDPLGRVWNDFYDESGNLTDKSRTNYQPTQHDRFANFPTPDQVGTFDYDNLIGHEAGHFLGLSDEYSKCKLPNGKWVNRSDPVKAKEYVWKNKRKCIVELKPGLTGSIMARDDTGVVKPRHIEELAAAHDLNGDLKNCKKPLSLHETSTAPWGDLTMQGNAKVDSEFKLKGYATRTGWLTAGKGNPNILITGTFDIDGWRRGPFFSLKVSGNENFLDQRDGQTHSSKRTFVYKGRLKNGIFSPKPKKVNGWTITTVIKSQGAGAQ